MDQGFIVIRFEQEDSSFISYKFSGGTFAARVAELYPMMEPGIPGILQPLVDGFLFGLRHGPLQKILKLKGMRYSDFEAACNGNKNAAAASALAFIMFDNIRSKSWNNEIDDAMPIDITRHNLAEAYTGVIQRAPEYDGDEHAETVEAAVAIAITEQSEASI